jgi:hypothetical protein
MASTAHLPQDPPSVITTRYVFEADGHEAGLDTSAAPARAPERADRRDRDPDRARWNRDDPFDIPIVWDR